MTYIAAIFLYVYFSWYLVNINGFVQAVRFKFDDAVGLDTVFSGLLAVIQTILLAAFLFSHANAMLIVSTAMVLPCYVLLSIIAVKRNDIKRVINLRRLGIVIVYKRHPAIVFNPVINPFTALISALYLYSAFKV